MDNLPVEHRSENTVLHQRVKDLEADRESLRNMVRVLSALVDLQELPRDVSAADYRRMLQGFGIKRRHQFSPTKEKKKPL